MPSINCRKAVGLLLVALSASAPLAQAASSEELEERALKLDQSVQAFKKEALAFGTEAQVIEDDVLYPAHSRLSVYLSIKVPGLLLKDVSVSVDNGAPQTFSYTDRDAKALLADKHVQRVMRANVAPGAHRLRISYSGQMADAKEGAAPVGDSYEAVFDKDQRPTDLEISIARRNRLSKAGISMKQWRSSK
ncbi:MAG TPA: hypothetical protein VLI06_03700 [Solimonas sp.]|nr:hypothetical protein [Solimonas sp.]